MLELLGVAVALLAPMQSTQSAQSAPSATPFASSSAVSRITSASPNDLDGDGDGLSDFQELHKYFTDPTNPDSDGDWNERRDYAYTVRTILDVMPPVTSDVLCDDYQDARILEQDDGHFELEVIHYPVNTVAGAIVADPDWREHASHWSEWTRPGTTANWDAELRDEIVAALRKEGIDPAKLDDKTLVERASRFLLHHATYVNCFTTYDAEFEDGKARVLPGLEAAVEDGRPDKSLSIDEQWQRELFAKGMFEHGSRGSCTSSAIYLDGCLRALGVPTRVVLFCPAIDPSDEREFAMVEKRVTNHRVRKSILDALRPLGRSWANHTFNEVLVGGRWRRLNYERLGQDILDKDYFGLMTHVATVSDWADGQFARTWGLRESRADREEDRFGGSNPYRALTISDRFGEHAKLDNPEVQEWRRLTISKLYWWSSPDRKIDMRLDEPQTAGHLLMHVNETRAGEGTEQYSSFYAAADKDFTLLAEGRPPVRAHATRGFWCDASRELREFHVHIDPAEFAKLEPDVAYRIVPRNDAKGCEWAVADGVSIALDATTAAAVAAAKTATLDATPASAAPAAPTAPSTKAGEQTLTIDSLAWSDDAALSESLRRGFTDKPPVLLAHVAEWNGWDAFKKFTDTADKHFVLEAEGRRGVDVLAATGGVTNSNGSIRYAILYVPPSNLQKIERSVAYTLRPKNEVSGWRWIVAEGVRSTRAQ